MDSSQPHLRSRVLLLFGEAAPDGTVALAQRVDGRVDLVLYVSRLEPETTLEDLEVIAMAAIVEVMRRGG